MANSSPDDLTAQLRIALRNMADAYERRIRTDCTVEQLALEPWRCAEYIEAERLCKRPFKLLIDNETLKRQIAAEPDGMSCEAGVLHPEAPKPETEFMLFRAWADYRYVAGTLIYDTAWAAWRAAASTKAQKVEEATCAFEANTRTKLQEAHIERDRREAELQSKVMKYEAAFKVARERTAHLRAEWAAEPWKSTPGSFFDMTSQNTRDALAAFAYDITTAEQERDKYVRIVASISEEYSICRDLLVKRTGEKVAAESALATAQGQLAQTRTNYNEAVEKAALYLFRAGTAADALATIRDDESVAPHLQLIMRQALRALGETGET